MTVTLYEVMLIMIILNLFVLTEDCTKMLDMMLVLHNSQQRLSYKSSWHYLLYVILLFLKEMMKMVKSFTRLQVQVRLLM